MSQQTGADHEAMHDAIRRTAVALGQADIPFALCGGYAAFARGAPEPSHDADFVIREEHAQSARAAVRDAGLEVRDPAEDWLFKAYNGEAMVDVLFRMCGRPVPPEVLDRAELLEVVAVWMPVLTATDIMSTKLRVLNEHYCDLARLLPVARALREQIDWTQVRREVAGNPYAEAFLHLTDTLRITSA